MVTRWKVGLDRLQRPRGRRAAPIPGCRSIERIDAPEAWKSTLGSPSVKVGVADTGLDFTHSELGPRILDVVDFTGGNSTGGTCPTGYCHLGGAAISDRDAYGSGVIDAGKAVRRF
jgi:hypothetical protein